LRELVNRARTPIIVARNVGTPLPLRRVLVPTTGALFSRLGATIAMLYASAVSAEITALFVKESPIISLRSFSPRRSNEFAQTAPITGEIRAFGQQLGISIEARAITSSKPENAILLAADRENFDLIVMGVQIRPTEHGLYFGPKVEHILRNARCAIAVVVTPETSLRE
jgi:nucleotide-binding universal stress UspA family protein